MERSTQDCLLTKLVSDTIFYEITVTNVGFAATADIVIIDPLLGVL